MRFVSFQDVYTSAHYGKDERLEINWMAYLKAVQVVVVWKPFP